MARIDDLTCRGSEATRFFVNVGVGSKASFEIKSLNIGARF
jgi:hypothetical protein